MSPRIRLGQSTRGKQTPSSFSFPPDSSFIVRAETARNLRRFSEIAEFGKNKRTLVTQVYTG